MSAIHATSTDQHCETHTTSAWSFSTASPSLTSFLNNLHGMGASTLFATSFNPSAFSYQLGGARVSWTCFPRWKIVILGPSVMIVLSMRVWGKKVDMEEGESEGWASQIRLG